MYPSSTQFKFWTFASSDELDVLRKEANEAFIKMHRDKLADCSLFLTHSEECQLRKYYEGKLKRFCFNFQPTMPNYVLGTAMAYFKRIFLHHSVMEPIIEDYMYTCIYLACKTEEFNVSVGQLIMNIRNGDEKLQHRILTKELAVMDMLHYHLTVHNPYRAMEGLLIDIKTRCTDITDPERLRPGLEQFFDKSVLTDACLLFPPSQIALAAIITSGTNLGLNVSLDSYIANKLLQSGSYELQKKMAMQLQKIRSLVRNLQETTYDNVTTIISKMQYLHKMLIKKSTITKKHRLEDADEDGDDDDADSNDAVNNNDNDSHQHPKIKRMKLTEESNSDSLTNNFQESDDMKNDNEDDNILNDDGGKEEENDDEKEKDDDDDDYDDDWDT